MPNVAEQLESRLVPAQLCLLRRVSSFSTEQRVSLYLVGGTVRDMLAGGRPADLDLVVVRPHPHYASMLAEWLDGELAGHSQFATFKLRAGGIELDLASARSESYAHPGALPTVSPGDIQDDMARRDFSINAMAVSMEAATWGDLLDPFRGWDDLRRGVIRALHSNSFVDDATRILRAVRYAGRLGFRLEAETGQLLRRNLRYLDSIGGDRLRHEMELVLREPKMVQILETSDKLGVLAAVHPALKIDNTLLDGVRRSPVGPDVDGALALLAALISRSDDRQIAGLAARLNLEGRWARVARDVSQMGEAHKKLKHTKKRPSQTVKLLRNLDIAVVKGWSIATDDLVVRGRLELYLSELRHVRPLLGGDDLMALGVPEGPVVGEILERLLTARLDGLLSTRQDEENMVARSLRRGAR